jgi:hypothetical protein
VACARPRSVSASMRYDHSELSSSKPRTRSTAGPEPKRHADTSPPPGRDRGGLDLRQPLRHPRFPEPPRDGKLTYERPRSLIGRDFLHNEQSVSRRPSRIGALGQHESSDWSRRTTGTGRRSVAGHRKPLTLKPAAAEVARSVAACLAGGSSRSIPMSVGACVLAYGRSAPGGAHVESSPVSAALSNCLIG